MTNWTSLNFTNRSWRRNRVFIFYFCELLFVGRNGQFGRFIPRSDPERLILRELVDLLGKCDLAFPCYSLFLIVRLNVITWKRGFTVTTSIRNSDLLLSVLDQPMQKASILILHLYLYLASSKSYARASCAGLGLFEYFACCRLLCDIIQWW